MSKKITAKQLIAKTRQFAEDNPNNLYEHDICNYATGECSNGAIGCIFGQVLHALGVPKLQLQKFDSNQEEGGITIESLIDKCPDLFNPVSEANKKWLLIVQGAQDRGCTWATAVREADETFPN